MKYHLPITLAVLALGLPSRSFAQAPPVVEPLPAVEKTPVRALESMRLKTEQNRQQVAAVRDRLSSSYHRAGDAGQTLIIRPSDSDPKAQANLEEDLAVMARLLDKAAARGHDEDQRQRAMGINLMFGPGAHPVRNFYLEGYGALFMMNAGFPLLKPAAKPPPPKDEPPRSSAWEEARRELYGTRQDRKAATAPAEDYSEEKVSRLRDAVLEALKNAANVRDLKPDDSITVCVFGAPTSLARVKGIVKLATTASADPDNRVVTVERNDSEAAGATQMVIQVKKSDVDAFSKGELDLEAFRKKAKLRTSACAGDPGKWPGWFSFDFDTGGGIREAR